MAKQNHSLNPYYYKGATGINIVTEPRANKHTCALDANWATRHRIVGGLSLAITPSPHPWVGGIVRVGGPLLFDHPPCNIFMGTNKRYPCMQGGNLGGNNSYSCKLTNHPSNQSHCPPRLPYIIKGPTPKQSQQAIEQ